MASRAEGRTSFELGGSRYRMTASGYCTRDGRRIRRAEFDEARGRHYEQLGEQWARIAEEGYEASLTIAGREAEERKRRAMDEVEEGKDREMAEKKETRKRRPRDVAFECEVGGRQVTLTSRQCEFLQAASSCPCWAEGGTGIWLDVLLDECGMNGMSFGAMVSTLREKHLLEVEREDREDPVTGRSRRCKAMRLTRLGKVVVARAGHQLPPGM